MFKKLIVTGVSVYPKTVPTVTVVDREIQQQLTQLRLTIIHHSTALNQRVRVGISKLIKLGACGNNKLDS